MTDLFFGECPECGDPLERPFWDTICFACQESDEDDVCSVCQCADDEECCA